MAVNCPRVVMVGICNFHWPVEPYQNDAQSSCSHTVYKKKLTCFHYAGRTSEHLQSVTVRPWNPLESWENIRNKKCVWDNLSEALPEGGGDFTPNGSFLKIWNVLIKCITMRNPLSLLHNQKPCAMCYFWDFCFHLYLSTPCKKTIVLWQ